MAGGRTMNTLQEAVQDYLALRRSLGFKLRDAGKGAIGFCRVHGAAACLLYYPSLSTRLGATEPRRHHRPWAARRLSWVRCFARHRSATDPRTRDSAGKLITVSTKAGATLSVFKRRDPGFAERSAPVTCCTATRPCGPGSTIVYSAC